MKQVFQRFALRFSVEIVIYCIQDFIDINSTSPFESKLYYIVFSSINKFKKVVLKYLIQIQLNTILKEYFVIHCI